MVSDWEIKLRGAKPSQSKEATGWGRKASIIFDDMEAEAPDLPDSEDLETGYLLADSQPKLLGQPISQGMQKELKERLLLPATDDFVHPLPEHYNMFAGDLWDQPDSEELLGGYYPSG